jgi:hypothetical protein
MEHALGRGPRLVFFVGHAVRASCPRMASASQARGPDSPSGLRPLPLPSGKCRSDQCGRLSALNAEDVTDGGSALIVWQLRQPTPTRGVHLQSGASAAVAVPSHHRIHRCASIPSGSHTSRTACPTTRYPHSYSCAAHTDEGAAGFPPHAPRVSGCVRSRY